MRPVLFLLVAAVATASMPAFAQREGEGSPASPRYALRVTLAPDARRMDVTGTVHLPADPRPREEIRLALSSAMSELTAEIVEPAVAAGPARLTKVVEGQAQTTWGIRPVRAVPAGSPVSLRFAYSCKERGGFVLSLGPDCSFASGTNVAWYPQVEGERDEATGTLEFDVPPGTTVVATGRPDRGTDAARGIFRFDVPRKSDFAFAAGRYSPAGPSATVPVRGYLLRPRPGVDEYLRRASEVLGVLAAEFGPYPYHEFSIVEVPADQANAAGFQGVSVEGFILVSGTYLDRAFEVPYYAHELSHQWWGNLVKRTGARGRSMLDEAMAQYGALAAVEALEGRASAEKFRRSGFGGGARQYFESAAAGFDRRLDDLPAELSLQVAWTKGGIALDMLAREVGRDRFRRALHEVTGRHAFGYLTWEEFVAAVRAHAPRDIDWFLREWFERPGAPEWSVDWRQEGGVLRVTIAQPEPAYRAGVELQILGANFESASKHVEIRGPRTELSWAVPFRATEVVLDPHFEVLHWTADERARARALAPYVRATREREAGRLDQAEAQFKEALASVTEPDLHGAKFMLEYGLARVLFEKNRPEEAKALLESAVRRPVRPAGTLPWVYFGFALLAKMSNDAEGLRRAADAALTADVAAGGNTGVAEDIRGLTADAPRP